MEKNEKLQRETLCRLFIRRSAFQLKVYYISLFVTDCASLFFMNDVNDKPLIRHWRGQTHTVYSESAVAKFNHTKLLPLVWWRFSLYYCLQSHIAILIDLIKYTAWRRVSSLFPLLNLSQSWFSSLTISVQQNFISGGRVGKKLF